MNGPDGPAHDRQLDVEAGRYAYDKILQCRDLELELHVGRSNLCLVIEAALIAVVAPAILGKEGGPIVSDWIAALLVSVFGLLLSAVCVTVVRGADFWISYWEHRLSEAESAAMGDVTVFRNHPSKRNRNALLALPQHLKYVSSRNAIRRLFLILTVVWAALTIYSALGLLGKWK